MSDSKESSKSNVVVSNTLSANDKELLFGSQNFSGELLSKDEMNDTKGELFNIKVKVCILDKWCI